MKWKKDRSPITITIVIIIITIMIIMIVIIEETMKKLVGTQSKFVLEKMQKATISYSLHIARYFKATVL